MATKTIAWGFSEPGTDLSRAQPDQRLWRLKSELFMALNVNGIGNFDDLLDIEFLGNGTSFTVQACTTQMSSQLVAVKRLRRSEAKSQSRYIEILLREFQILSYEPLRDTTTLVNILGYGWQKHADLPSIVIEYADYGTLDKFFYNRGNFVGVAGWDLCRSLCLDVAVALEVLHANGIIHGDIKTENVLVYLHETKYATAKVSDFGHSIFHSDAGEHATYLGTPIYNPPEVLRLSESDVTAQMNMVQLSKCDVWSFGLMAWCTMNGGKSYFQDEWLSQDQGYIDKSAFLIDQAPNFLQLASSVFLRESEALVDAAAPIKVMFADVLWKCLHGVNEERCSIRDASILLDSEREWQHSEFADFKEVKLEKISFRTFQVFDCIDSDIPWHFRRSLFNDLLATEEIPQNYQGHCPYASSFCYISNHELSSKLYDGNQAWPIAACYATGFGIDVNLKRMLDYLELDNKIPGHTEIFLDRIKYAHGKHTITETQGIKGESFQHVRWFANSIHAYQSAMYGARQLNMSSAHFQSNQFDLHDCLSWNALGRAFAEYPHEDVDITGRDGSKYLRPLLHFAIDRNDGPLLCDLIKWGVNVDQQDGEGRTALFEACSVGNLQLALILLAAGANPSIRDSGGTYPLHFLIFFSWQEIGQIGRALVDTGAEPDVSMAHSKAWNLGWHGIALSATPLHFAVSCRNAEAIQTLLKIGANVNIRVHYISPLDVAVSYHMPEICELLINAGAEVGTYWVTGQTPLHGFGNLSRYPSYAKWMIHGAMFLHAATATIQLVIKHGVDIQARNLYGDTALSIAMKDRTDDMYAVKAILEQYNLLGIPLDPLLIFAAIDSSSFNNSCSKITEVLKYGFEQTLRNSDGNTPLHHCVIKGAIAALRMLVTLPATNLDLRNRDGFTPLHLASRTGFADCLDLLCENGASVDLRVDDSENVALTLALAAGNVDVFYMLLKRNADIWLGNSTSNGPTALHVMCHRELLSRPMDPASVGNKDLPMLRAPLTSLASDVFCHEQADTLYALIDREPALLNARDRRGRACLHVAINGADLAAVEILLHAGADRSLRDGSGLNLLEFLELLLADIKRWRGGHSAQLGGIFDEIRQLLQD